jgi:hypothetical protein
MQLRVTNDPQALVGLVALLIIPLLLGVRHASPMHFLLYAAYTGVLFTIGSVLTDARRHKPDAVELVVEWWIRVVAVILVGGLLFVLALLFL